MAFSWNWPQLARPIKDDVPAISAMLNAAVRWNPEYGGGTDLAAGMKRLADVSGGVQLQSFSGTTWASIGKLMHDVDTLDGHHASTTAVKNTIPVYNADALLPGGITGNAGTATKLKTARAMQVGGIASGSAVNFDGSAPVTLNVDSITLNNDEDDAVNGVLTAAHGGTGRTDGAAQDVRVASLAGEVSAKAYGQIGRAKVLGSLHLDSLVVDGFYVGGAKSDYHSEAYGYPHTGSGVTFLRVTSANQFITQILETDCHLWRRHSIDSGATWTGWLTVGGTHYGNIAIYISKSGSDKNTGFSAEYPVQTIARAMRIARGLSIDRTSGYVVFRIGEGNWGDVTFRRLPFTLLLEPYDGTNPTAYSESLPKFGTVYSMGSYIEAYGLVADAVQCAYDGTFVISGGYKRIGALRARVGGMIYLTSQNASTNVLEMHQQSVYTDNLITAYEGGYINAQYLHIKLAENVSCSGYLLQVGAIGTISMYKGRTVFETGAYTFTGKAVQVQPAGVFRTAENDGAMTFFNQVPGTGIDIQNGAIVNGYTMGQAADNAVVHLTGDETIGGTKTFSDNFIVEKSTPTIFQKNEAYKKGTIPTSHQYWNVMFCDSEGISAVNRIGGIMSQVSKDSGDIITRIMAYKPEEDSNEYTDIEIVHPKSGAPYLTAPTTPDGSTGRQIVTADWLYKRGFAEAIPEKANQDANLYLTTGSYWLKSTAVNIPSGSNGLLCVYSKGNIIRQVFFRQGTVGSNDHNIFTRQLGDPVDGVPTVIGDWVQMITSKDARLVIPGTVIAFAGNPSSAPSGYLLCNGAAVSRTTYAKLFEAIGTTYGTGNGSTTFNLPDLTGRFIQGYDNDFPVGSVKLAGLPNVTGTFRALSGSTSGVFSESATWVSDDPGDSDMSKVNVAVTMDLSTSNSIYGSSTTVQPPALTMRFYIKY